MQLQDKVYGKPYPCNDWQTFYVLHNNKSINDEYKL